MKRCISLLLCLLVFPCFAYAVEGAYLSGEDLQKLQPQYEAFLESLSEILVKRGLLQEGEQEDWILYQLGDYIQNGGFGSFIINYAPGILDTEDEMVTMRRFTVETDAGTLVLETLRRYVVNYSSLPGLPLDTALFDAEGQDLPCRFRWIAQEGKFYVWDGMTDEVVDVGTTYISDGRPLYWYADPSDGLEETLTIEILDEVEDVQLASVTLLLASGEDYWAPEGLR